MSKFCKFAILLLITFVFVAGCNKTNSDEPSLKETTDYMHKSLDANFGQRFDISKDVVIIKDLRSDGCKLTYLFTDYESSEYDLSDINPNSIKLEKIGTASWVTFYTRNFNHSIKHIGLKDHTATYSTDHGGFALNTEEHAASFA